MLPVVDISPSELDELREQLAAIGRQLDAGFSRVASTYKWQRLHIKPRIVGGAWIAEVFSLLNGGAIAAGIVLTVIGGSLDSLGVALASRL